MPDALDIMVLSYKDIENGNCLQKGLRQAVKMTTQVVPKKKVVRITKAMDLKWMTAMSEMVSS